MRRTRRFAPGDRVLRARRRRRPRRPRRGARAARDRFAGAAGRARRGGGAGGLRDGARCRAVQAGLRPGELLVVNGANGGVGTAAVQIAAAAGARVLATVRSVELRDAIAALGATGDRPGRARPARAGRRWRRRRAGARRRPNLDADLLALAAKGRIVIVGTGAGAEATLDLRKLMGRRGVPARDDVARPAARRGSHGDAGLHTRGRSSPRLGPDHGAGRPGLSGTRGGCGVRPAGRAGQARQGAARLREQ